MHSSAREHKTPKSTFFAFLQHTCIHDVRSLFIVSILMITIYSRNNLNSAES